MDTATEKRDDAYRVAGWRFDVESDDLRLAGKLTTQEQIRLKAQYDADISAADAATYEAVPE
jgi:hypothetical protein